MKTRKWLAIVLMLLLAAMPATAKMTVANQKYKKTKTSTQVRNSQGSKCSNGQTNCQPDKGTTAVTTGTTMSAMAQEVVRQTNMERAKLGLSQLKVSSELTRAANVRATEIASFFSHTRIDGTKWNTVSSSARGENIARGQQSADKVMAAWMTSSGHRANIVRASFGSIGVSAYKVGNVMHWVQIFGA